MDVGLIERLGEKVIAMQKTIPEIRQRILSTVKNYMNLS